MKGVNGVQMNVHPKFLSICKDIVDARVKKSKERSRELSHKRLTLTFYKLLQSKPELFDLIVNSEINLNEV